MYINEAYNLLSKGNLETLEKAESVLGELEESSLDTLFANLQKIQDKILSPKLVILKENYLDTEKDHILASVKEDDSYTFTVYENFFDKKEFKDNRAGVIIHEIAHLCDIEEGADMYDVDSAECLKNIILHLNNKITLDEIQAEYTRKQEPQERDDDTLTYDPDQPRVPAGSPEGGQWTDSGGSVAGLASSGMPRNVSSLNNTPTRNRRDFSARVEKNIKIDNKEYAKDSLSLSFDGISLKVLSDDKEILSYPAISGANGYQLGKYQKLKDKGPLPEGNFTIKQKDAQIMTLRDDIGGVFNKGKFPGGSYAWGGQRVWITPNEGTNTYGRDNFSIHGGVSRGSKGCIDLTSHNRKFMNLFRDTGRDLSLSVKYLDDNKLEEEIKKYNKNKKVQ